MWKFIFFIPLSCLIPACGGENSAPSVTDSAIDTTRAVVVPTFDISGNFYVRLNHTLLSDTATADYYSIPDAKETDTLFIRYLAAEPCEECRLETQIWIDSKYKDLVRDTGYGNGDWTVIPLARLNYDPERKGPQDIAFYLSVRQYHPVETGNKRFLFNLQLDFRESEN